MASRNTRIDVEVNTQNARTQLRELANETSRLNNNQNQGSSSSGPPPPPANLNLLNNGPGNGAQNPLNSGSSSNQNTNSTNQNSAGSGTNQNTGAGSSSNQNNLVDSSDRAQNINSTINLLRQQSAERQKDIRKDYQNLRQANTAEFDDFSQRHQAGQMSDDDFNDYRKGYQENQINSFSDERNDLTEEQKKTNELLREMLDREDESTQNQVEALQNDNSESNKPKGILGNLFEERSRLMNLRNSTDDEGEIKSSNKALDKINKEISKRTGGKGDTYI